MDQKQQTKYAQEEVQHIEKDVSYSMKVLFNREKITFSCLAKAGEPKVLESIREIYLNRLIENIYSNYLILQSVQLLAYSYLLRDIFDPPNSAWVYMNLYHQIKDEAIEALKTAIITHTSRSKEKIILELYKIYFAKKKTNLTISNRTYKETILENLSSLGLVSQRNKSESGRGISWAYFVEPEKGEQWSEKRDALYEKIKTTDIVEQKYTNETLIFYNLENEVLDARLKYFEPVLRALNKTSEVIPRDPLWQKRNEARKKGKTISYITSNVNRNPKDFNILWPKDGSPETWAAINQSDEELKRVSEFMRNMTFLELARKLTIPLVPEVSDICDKLFAHMTAKCEIFIRDNHAIGTNRLLKEPGL